MGTELQNKGEIQWNLSKSETRSKANTLYNRHNSLERNGQENLYINFFCTNGVLLRESATNFTGIHLMDFGKKKLYSLTSENKYL